MAAAKREHSIHVRVSDEVDAAIELAAQATGREKTVVAAEWLEDAVLGRPHALKVAAMRFARLGLSGTDRERA